MICSDDMRRPEIGGSQVDIGGANVDIIDDIDDVRKTVTTGAGC